MRDEACTLVGPRRAAIGFRRHRDHEQPARRHRFELTLQEPGLGAGLPCVWHPCGRLLAIARDHAVFERSEEHTSELQSLMRISYAVLCLKKQKNTNLTHYIN